MNTTKETHREYNDSLARGCGHVNVSLCQGIWHTFFYITRCDEPLVLAHAGRDEARAYAREALSGKLFEV